MPEVRTEPLYINELIGRRLGYQGQFGDGGFQSFLDNDPTIKQEFLSQFNQATAQQGGRNFALSEVDTPIDEFFAQQGQNPVLPSGGEQVPVTQDVQQNELLTGQNAQLDPNAQNIQGVNQVTAPTAQTAQGTAATTDSNQVLQQAGFDPNVGQMEATYTSDMGGTPQAVAQQGQVSELATMQGQLKKLYNEIDETGKPAWARGAINSAEERMAARGMAASSISSQAITAAVQASAMPIAAQDASTYFQMDMANLNNRQATELENTRMRQQSMLTDTAIANATSQFNASSEAQVQQFVTSLVATMAEQNANRVTSMSQFNAAEQNQMNAFNAGNQLQADTFNSQMEFAVKEYNSRISHERELFNSNMQFAIEQSNVQWRRTLNTQNTASVNAANATNVQNRFNMSQVALNNIWQQWRDEASWAFSASENEKDRQFKMYQASIERDYKESIADQSTGVAVGKLAIDLLGSDALSNIGSFF